MRKVVPCAVQCTLYSTLVLHQNRWKYNSLIQYSYMRILYHSFLKIIRFIYTVYDTVITYCSASASSNIFPFLLILAVEFSFLFTNWPLFRVTQLKLPHKVLCLEGNFLVYSYIISKFSTKWANFKVFSKKNNQVKNILKR